MWYPSDFARSGKSVLDHRLFSFLLMHPLRLTPPVRSETNRVWWCARVVFNSSSSSSSSLFHWKVDSIFWMTLAQMMY